jgi:hypothetical protein
MALTDRWSSSIATSRRPGRGWFNHVRHPCGNAACGQRFQQLEVLKDQLCLGRLVVSCPALSTFWPYTHHDASAQVFAAGDAGTLFVWIADLLPDEAAGRTAEMTERGINAVKHTLEHPEARPG